MPFLICCKAMGCGVVPCILLQLLTCAFPSPALVLAPLAAGLHLEGLEWKEPSMWEGLQPFHPSTAVSVPALCPLGCHPWKWFSYPWGFHVAALGLSLQTMFFFSGIIWCVENWPFPRV